MIHLAEPWWLIFFPLPLILYWLLPAIQVSGASALKAPFFNTIVTLNPQTSLGGQRSLLNLLFGLCLWSLLIFAASNPQWLGKPVLMPQSGRDIMLAVDLSGSMQIPDMELQGQFTNRLAVVKALAHNFIETRKADRLGLILFGTHAYLQTPLTFDRETVSQMLDDASIGLAGSETAIGDAIGLAIKRLEAEQGKSKVIILLTDGGNNSGVLNPNDAAQIASKLGIKIYTIGIGADKLIVPGVFGPEEIHPTSAVDEESLQKIAAITHGMFFRAQNTADLTKVYASLNQIVPVTTANSMYRPTISLYPWPLAIALILSSLLALRRVWI